MYCMVQAVKDLFCENSGPEHWTPRNIRGPLPHGDMYDHGDTDEDYLTRQGR